MSASIERANNRFREFLCIQGQVRKWHDFVVAAVVKEYWDAAREFRSKVLCQSDALISLIPPAITAPIRGGKKE
jgi:hypothetical protein